MAQEGEPEHESLIGKTLGGYQLIDLLGVGGMAEVYRAKDPRLKREVAVKVLPRNLARDLSYVARFRTEAERAAAFVHPNVVPVYAHGEQDGLLYLVMPVLGASVRDRLDREGKLDPMEAARLAYQVAAALDAAHRRGLVHRDVKPENILLGPDGRAMLTDFGIARELDTLQMPTTNYTLSVTGLPVGTPEYMAPEQLGNKPIDQRIDIYSLGIVLYEMLTGRVPHEAETPYLVAARVINDPVPPPSQLNPSIWPALDIVVLNALAKDPNERYPNMRSFATDIRSAATAAGKTRGRWGALERTSHPVETATRLGGSLTTSEQSVPLPNLTYGPNAGYPYTGSVTIPRPPISSSPTYIPGGGPQPYATMSPAASVYAPLYPRMDTPSGPREEPRAPVLSLPVIVVLLLAVLALGTVGGIVLVHGLTQNSGSPSIIGGVGGHASSTLTASASKRATATHVAAGTGATATSGATKATATPNSQPHIRVASSQVTLAPDGSGNCVGSQTMTNDSSVDAVWSWSGLPTGQARLTYSINPHSANTLTAGTSVTVTMSEPAPCGGNSASISVMVTGGSASPGSFTLNY